MQKIKDDSEQISRLEFSLEMKQCSVFDGYEGLRVQESGRSVFEISITRNIMVIRSANEDYVV